MLLNLARKHSVNRKHGGSCTHGSRRFGGSTRTSAKCSDLRRAPFVGVRSVVHIHVPTSIRRALPFTKARNAVNAAATSTNRCQSRASGRLCIKTAAKTQIAYTDQGNSQPADLKQISERMLGRKSDLQCGTESWGDRRRATTRNVLKRPSVMARLRGQSDGHGQSTVW
jgi:hypothetical protein